ncbi:glycoside hydrolase, partial [Rozella allomycis CSF55]
FKHVVHDGYISILPLLLGIVDCSDKERLQKLFETMQNPEKLNSPFGLRSLSLKDELYGTEENYWRGAIWINMNYLALKSLKNNYMHESCPLKDQAKDIYDDLRTKIINTMTRSYEKTGTIWENYSPENGNGQRSKHFTGWSSLIVLIISEIY